MQSHRKIIILPRSPGYSPCTLESQQLQIGDILQFWQYEYKSHREQRTSPHHNVESASLTSESIRYLVTARIPFFSLIQQRVTFDQAKVNSHNNSISGFKNKAKQINNK